MHGLIFTYTLFPNPTAIREKEVVTLEINQTEFSMKDDATELGHPNEIFDELGSPGSSFNVVTSKTHEKVKDYKMSN